MSSTTKHIVVTGDPADLQPRLPTSIRIADTSECAIKWTVLPVLDFEPLKLPQMLLESLEQGLYDWIIFSSPRAAKFFADQLGETPLAESTRLAGMGKRTAECLQTAGLPASFYPTDAGTEGFLESFTQQAVNNSESPPHVLLIGAEEGRPDLAQSLMKKGYQITSTPIYRTHKKPLSKTKWESLKSDGTDLLILTSPSSAEAMKDYVHDLPSSRIACLGEYTASHLKSLGIKKASRVPNANYDRVGEILC